MPFGSKKVTMYLPPDATLNDDSNKYTHFNGEKIIHKETTKLFLWSEK
jgi:hypothetical protein